MDALEIFGLSVVNANDKNRPVTGLPGYVMKLSTVLFLVRDGTPISPCFFFLLLRSRIAEGDDESEYASTRYVPALKAILEALSVDELSMEEYPSVTPMPTQSSSQAGRTTARSSRKASGSAASARKNAGPSSRWAASSRTEGKRSGGPVTFTGARNMVFVMGGMCYSEMRVAREVMENESREIILGSTAFLSAKEFIEDLGKLADQKR